MNTFRLCSNSQRGVRNPRTGRHRFDSDASHSAPSTRQDGAHNVNKQRKHNGRKQTTVGNMGALRRHRPRQQPGIRPNVRRRT
ncbi:hypothetical protein GA610_01505 [Bifidobacterium adolescentis]|nr:hypothetical protein GA610_01505 [Bifidobacterium adolescentis]KAB5923744.1 hypothetical protein GA617_05230 [Bifidobacterium adolescentis]